MIAISIIIPVFNSELWLGRCLDSVISQRFTEHFEIILVDDGSTDGCGAICDAYAKRFSNITVFHTDNQGASLARKYGLEKALGKYVTFIDSDDYVKDGYLETLYKLAVETDCSITACAVEGSVGGSESREPYILTYDELMPRFFKYEFWGLVAKLYKRDLFDGILFPSATLSEDYVVMAHLFEKERLLAYSPMALYVYDHHLASLSHTPLSKKAFEEFDNVKAVLDFTSVRMPEYRDYALSNATETAIKLLVASRKQPQTYSQQRKELKLFLAQNRREIHSCKPLNRKVAFLALLLEKV